MDFDFWPDLTGNVNRPPRNVVYDEEAVQAIDDFCEKSEILCNTLEEIIRYIEWQLVHNPDNEYSCELSEDGKRLFGIYFSRPEVVVVYSFNHESVFIHRVRIT